MSGYLLRASICKRPTELMLERGGTLKEIKPFQDDAVSSDGTVYRAAKAAGIRSPILHFTCINPRPIPLSHLVGSLVLHLLLHLSLALSFLLLTLLWQWTLQESLKRLVAATRRV